MSYGKIGKPYGFLHIDEETSRLLNSIDGSTLHSYKFIDLEHKDHYGFNISFDIRGYDNETFEDVNSYMDPVPKEHRTRSMPIADAYFYTKRSFEAYETQIQASFSPDESRKAIVLVGEDSSIWVYDKLFMYKATNSLQEFMFLPADLHWKLHYISKFDDT
jgi:hypothetical protein